MVPVELWSPRHRLLLRFLDSVVPLGPLIPMQAILGQVNRRAPYLMAAAGYLTAVLMSLSGLTLMLIFEWLSESHSWWTYVWVYAAATAGVRTVEGTAGRSSARPRTGSGSGSRPVAC